VSTCLEVGRMLKMTITTNVLDCNVMWNSVAVRCNH